ncbi:hypothetical protein GCM10017781_12680 [Deinococcus metalli]|nr:hypothetical protein GCM10017781_12680 [Deinococcus metalli]
MRALPLLIALVVVVGAGLFTLHVALPGVLLGAALSGVVAAWMIVLTAGWTVGVVPRRDPAPAAESLTGA